jgi:hypothetical protein
MQGHDYSYKVILLCFDSDQHDTLNDRIRSLSDEDISTPLNVRSCSLSGVEVNIITKKNKHMKRP